MKLEPKPVPGYENNYYLDPENMTVVNSKTGRVLKPRKDGAGYAEVQLWCNNKGTHKRLHRLFAEAYIPNPNNLPNINHKDENPMNYSLDNLEWCTQSYNQKYGTANERRGSKISKALKGKPKPWVSELKGKPVVAINKWGEETVYSSGSEAARHYGLTKDAVNNVVRGTRKTAGGMKFKRYIPE